MIKVIDKFENKYRFLSNFYPCDIVIENRVWKSAEHLYMSYKTLNSEEKNAIWDSETPGKAKRLGQKVTLRKDWEEIKSLIMEHVVWQKFYQNPNLARKLLATGNAELVEGNTWHDNYWGECVCENCKTKTKQNMLGYILMRVRTKLRKQV